MRKTKIAAVVLMMLVLPLALAFPATAMAEHLKGSNNWSVTFGTDAKMTDTFSSSEWTDDIRGLEPGDDITFTVTLNHKHPTACDWYMSNEVLKSLEAGAAEGSAYSYKLTYTGPTSSTSRTLYDSSTVGGDDTSGLMDATSAMDDFLYLDNLKQGQTGKVELVVGLDGETEGNAYFDTLAQLKMKFAVELNEPSKTTTTTTSTTSRTPVQTGDNTDLFPFYVAMVVSGALLAVLGGASLRARRREQQQQ